MALLKGTLDVLVLKTLSWGPMHGFEITSWLEQRSNGRLDVTDAALIQALHRLEARGLLSAEWGESVHAAYTSRPPGASSSRACWVAAAWAAIWRFAPLTGHPYRNRTLLSGSRAHSWG